VSDVGWLINPIVIHQHYRHHHHHYQLGEQGDSEDIGKTGVSGETSPDLKFSAPMSWHLVELVQLKVTGHRSAVECRRVLIQVLKSNVNFVVPPAGYRREVRSTLYPHTPTPVAPLMHVGGKSCRVAEIEFDNNMTDHTTDCRCYCSPIFCYFEYFTITNKTGCLAIAEKPRYRVR